MLAGSAAIAPGGRCVAEEHDVVTTVSTPVITRQDPLEVSRMRSKAHDPGTDDESRHHDERDNFRGDSAIPAQLGEDSGCREHGERAVSAVSQPEFWVSTQDSTAGT
jgi:hypothetical protein